jgi:GTP-binding protein EngB required for normal cell division
VPAYTTLPPRHRSEADLWGLLLGVDDGKLHFWNGLTPIGGTEIDILLVDLAGGAFCFEVKSLPLDQVKHLDFQTLERTNGVSGPSPFEQSLRNVRALGAILDRTWEDRPTLSPVSAFPLITRDEWSKRFSEGPMSEAAEWCLFSDDLKDLESLRGRLRTIAENPKLGHPRAPGSVDLQDSVPEQMHRAMFGSAPDDSLIPIAPSDHAKYPVLPLLDEVIALVDGPGAVYSSPGSDSLRLWRFALSAERVRLRVGVVGEFKAGKSSLINAILKREACYVDEFEATTVSATYTDGGVEGVVVVNDQDEVEYWSLDTFLDRCASRDLSGIGSITVTLRTGLPFDISDSPGLGSTSEGHSDEAEMTIQQTDLLLWTVDSNDAGSARESAFIQRAREIGLPLIVALTKSDVLGEGEADALIEYVASEAGVPKKDIIPVSAHEHLNGKDAGLGRLIARLKSASSGRENLQRHAFNAKLSEVVDGSRSILRFLLERNAPHARFLAAERAFLETSSLGIAHSAKSEWLQVLREECAAVAKSPDVQKAEDSQAVEAALGVALPEAVERATSKFLKSLHRLVRDEWRGALEQRSQDFEKRLADLLNSRPDAKADLEFLESERNAFKNRAEVITVESESIVTESRLWVMGIGAAAAVLTVSLLPLAVAGVVAVLATRDPLPSQSPQTVDTVLASRILDALVTSFESVGDGIELAIDRIVAEVAHRSLIRLVNARGGPDFQTILLIEQKAGDLLDELAALEKR